MMSLDYGFILSLVIYCAGLWVSAQLLLHTYSAIRAVVFWYNEDMLALAKLRKKVQSEEK